MKLSAKFARQEDEKTRLARITRRHLTGDRAAVIRRMLGLTETKPQHGLKQRTGVASEELLCPECGRHFRLAMHLGRHMSATHQRRSKTVAV
jgi:hypothetical protein